MDLITRVFPLVGTSMSLTAAWEQLTRAGAVKPELSLGNAIGSGFIEFYADPLAGVCARSTRNPK